MVWLAVVPGGGLYRLQKGKTAYDEHVSGLDLDDPVCGISAFHRKFYESKKVKHHSCLPASGVFNSLIN